MNTTVIMHNMIIEICQNSSPETGISMTQRFHKQLKEVKDFNYTHIYRHSRLEPFNHYSELVLTQLFDTLWGFYDGKDTLKRLEEYRHFTPLLIGNFKQWLGRYCAESVLPEGELKELSRNCQNEKIYQELQTPELYAQAIIDYISGMTDRFAISLFNELITY